ncbi:hypothetical protein [Dyadobacter sp. MSC1_007]|jgi:hypothetical protein|uniref:hypothetical protein n=1 Tax=Dyadobacter sp. MSC1_007 TaxID=2909264 RepID=UPI00202F4855|nr:hypothetical protein [Dyadobacter sp. MSC1_007]
MEGYTPYSDILKRLPDFRVQYQVLAKEGNDHRYILQGSRFDFRYSNDGHLKNSHYMIWPEFEDEGGFTTLDKWLPVQPLGTAKMWIVNQTLKEYHRLYLKVGSIGYITNGSEDIAICEVIEIVD